MTVLIALVIIAAIILVHEVGHFIAAKRIGIPVHEFSLGMGYKLFSTTKNGTEYSLRLIPIGGFVRMAGEDLGDLDDPNGFSKRTPLEKIRVAFAGPFMNLALALFIFIYTYAFIGIPSISDEPVIGSLVEGKPAGIVGLKPGDRIINIDGKTISYWSDITREIMSSGGKELAVTVARGAETIQYRITPEVDSSGVPAIGIMGTINYEKQGIINSIKTGFIQTYQLTVMMLGGLWMIISGGASAADLAGPVGIAQLVGEAAQGGAVFLLSFTAFLSINLGIINLLPIPALDGSRIVFAVVEAIRRKPLEPEKEGFIHWVGFLFLMMIIIIVTYNDIVRLIKG
ncbi:MAG: RIP metalloprotease RseP [Syntrophomonadaceae bacterium]